MADPFDTLSRMKTTPIPVARTRRQLDMRVLTSFMPGKMIPIAAIPLLREDRLSMSRFRLNFEQMETAELLVNAVNVRALAYLVPNLAFDRFDSIDHLNRSYMKKASIGDPDGAGAKTNYFNSMTAGGYGSHPLLKIMGIHQTTGSFYNNYITETYNQIWNMRAKNRSPDITLRLETDTTLAKAFWMHGQFSHIVPDFDQATIEGEVPLTISNALMPVRGLGIDTASLPGATQTMSIRETGKTAPTTGVTGWQVGDRASGAAIAGEAFLGVKQQAGTPTGFPDIHAELSASGISVSLANIELARKTQAFAALRRQYTGHDDDYIIDMLMNGLTVPEQAWREPILLADRATVVGMAKRYASDSTDLTASVTNGATFIDLALTTPVVPMGGVVMIVVEVTPEQLFERQEDVYSTIIDQDFLPEFLRDTLDPEKVEIVSNGYIDTSHATPNGTFGYAPLNHRWNRFPPRVGGKFFRPSTDAPTDEDRMRIWAVETANPTLSEDFYLCSAMHQKPFVVTNQDPYEVVLRGLAQVEGNTVFGRILIEASDDYNQILSDVPITPIVKP